MPKTISAYLVIMPKKADTHIQKIAPGPPAAIAVATPTMLPVPTVAASAVASAWNWEIALLSLLRTTLLSRNTARIVFFIA